MLAGVLALLGGASLGPEALVTDLVVTVSRRIWRSQDHRVSEAALFTALIGGMVGCGCGRALIGWRQGLRTRIERRDVRWMPLVTGLLLGLALWALPLAAFSGERQLGPLLRGNLPLSPALMILSGVATLLLAGLCLETGWRGGLIFPVILGSAAIGLGLHGLAPQLGGSLGSWSGSVVGGSLAALLPSPLAALVLGVTLLRGHGAAALVVGVVISQLGERMGLHRHHPCDEHP